MSLFDQPYQSMTTYQSVYRRKRMFAYSFIFFVEEVWQHNDSVDVGKYMLVESTHPILAGLAPFTNVRIPDWMMMVEMDTRPNWKRMSVLQRLAFAAMTMSLHTCLIDVCDVPRDAPVVFTRESFVVYSTNAWDEETVRLEDVISKKSDAELASTLRELSSCDMFVKKCDMFEKKFVVHVRRIQRAWRAFHNSFKPGSKRYESARSRFEKLAASN